MNDDIHVIRKAAQDEFYAEQRRRRIEEEKQRIRARANRSWWRRLFPFTVTGNQCTRI